MSSGGTLVDRLNVCPGAVSSIGHKMTESSIADPLGSTIPSPENSMARYVRQGDDIHKVQVRRVSGEYPAQPSAHA